MKEVFNVDINTHAQDKKLEEKLVESWDYFREKAAELGDE